MSPRDNLTIHGIEADTSLLGWALTFPNVGWILTLRKLGDIFHVNGFHIWNFVMTILMFTTWLILFVLTAIAFWEGKIFISRPEDVIRDQYGFTRIPPKHDLEMAMAGSDVRETRTDMRQMSIAHPDGHQMVEVHLETTTRA